MRARTLFAVVGAVLAFTMPAQAEIVLGDMTYPDSELPELQEACRGLASQARQSLTADVPDDLDNGDLGGAYRLSMLPFTARDCAKAGIH